MISSTTPSTVTAVTATNGVAGPWVSAADFVTIVDPDYSQAEVTIITDAPDTDNDGLIDVLEISGASCPGGYSTDPAIADTDSDGLLEGTECGLADPQSGQTNISVFVPDADPETTTNPIDADTDGDGLLDGIEDANLNGRLDEGETDPLTAVANPACIDAAILLLDAANEFKKSVRRVRKRCGELGRGNCAAKIQEQVDAFIAMETQHIVEQQTCQL